MFKKEIIYSEELYEKNLEKYACSDPLTAIKLCQSDFGDYSYGYTHLGELNLMRDIKIQPPALCRSDGALESPSKTKKITEAQYSTQTIFYHDMEGAYEEAKEWYRSVNLSKQTVVFIFGLGLGYYYAPLKLWLEKNPQNRLIFLEDEIGVIHHFLGTNLASELLSNEQVIVHYLDIYRTSDIQGRIHQSIDHLLKGYIRYSSFLGSTKLYAKLKEDRCLMIRDIIFYVSSWYLVMSAEILSKESGILTNHIHNTLRQYRAANGHLFRNLCSNIPAIICGAGPSIVSHIDRLKQLDDEAVIIASGTGMNVLNYYGITPHFGIGVDPTDSQGTRIRTNNAYEVPYFYRPRFQAKSFDLLHGPKIYIQGGPGKEISSFADEELGLEIEDLPNQGISSTNFAMQMARLMGCNPIILLGIDLAYVEASRYPPIISAHPTDSRKDKAEIAYQSEMPVYGQANSGKKVITKIEWFEESKTITSFKELSPEIELISCSPEGLEVQGVAYLPFSEAIEKYIGPSWDIRNRIHTRTIQSAPCVDREKSLEKMREWSGSLRKCARNFKEMEKELRRLWDSCLQRKKLESPPYSAKIALLEEETRKEPVFNFQLSDYIFIVDNMAIDKKRVYHCHSVNKTECQKELLQLEIDINYLVFFQDQLNYQDKRMEKLLEEFVEEERVFSEECCNQAAEVSLDEECYSVQEGFIAIDDQELDLHIRAPFAPIKIPEESLLIEKEGQRIKEIYIESDEGIDGQYLLLNAKGGIEAESFYNKGKLHGPSSYFHENGTLLARSWYIDGKKEGKTWQRYASGALYSLQRFRNGLWEGLQEYYYERGSLKSSLCYRKGILDGEVKLYYPNGRIKRELCFAEGKLEGTERYYGWNGRLIWEAHYAKGLPSGTAQVWHSNGELAREYQYSDDHTRYVLREWDEKGNLIAKEVNLLENLQQINENRLKNLTNAVNKFDRELKQLKHLTKRERSLFVF